jgi:hypothetical protein
MYKLIKWQEASGLTLLNQSGRIRLTLKKKLQMLKKLKQIWHEIIERWFLLTFYGERMERERLQVIAELVKKKDTLWKNIPPGIPRTIQEILTYKQPKKKSINELVEEYEKKSPIIYDALYKALKNIQQKEKENGNDKKETN